MKRLDLENAFVQTNRTCVGCAVCPGVMKVMGVVVVYDEE